MSKTYVDTSSAGKIAERIRRKAPHRIAAITGHKVNKFYHGTSTQTYTDFAIMQLNRALAGKTLTGEPTKTQIGKGLTPALAADALDLVVEELGKYAQAHLVELLNAADAFGIADEVAANIREVVG